MKIHLAITLALALLLSACQGSEGAPDNAPLKTRYALTSEAREVLETCVADETDGHPDADRQQAAYFCEVLLGIGSEGTINQPYARPEPALPRTLTALSKNWERGICGLRRGDGERELSTFLGPAHYRVELANGGLLLQWEEESAGVSADFDKDGLDKVTALQENKIPRPEERVKPRPDWQPKVTTLADMEAVLGKGTLVSVEWDRGLPIPPDDARRRGIDLERVTAGCRQRVVWPHLDTGLGSSAHFRDGVLKGVF